MAHDLETEEKLGMRSRRVKGFQLRKPGSVVKEMTVSIEVQNYVDLMAMAEARHMSMAQAIDWLVSRQVARQSKKVA